MRCTERVRGRMHTLSVPGGVPLATCALPVGMFYFTLLYATAPPSVRLLRVDIS